MVTVCFPCVLFGLGVLYDSWWDTSTRVCVCVCIGGGWVSWIVILMCRRDTFKLGYISPEDIICMGCACMCVGGGTRLHGKSTLKNLLYDAR